MTSFSDPAAECHQVMKDFQQPFEHLRFINYLPVSYTHLDVYKRQSPHTETINNKY